MTAKFAGRCGYCGGDIAPGEPIGRAPRVAGWVHEACVERAQPTGKEMSGAEFASRYGPPTEQQPPSRSEDD